MKKYLSILALLFLAGCAAGNSSNSSLDKSEDTEIIDSASSDKGEESLNSEDSQSKNEALCEIDFTTANINKGTGLAGDTNAANLEKLRQHMNSEVTIISSLAAEGKVNYNQCKRGESKSVILGSQSNSGKLTLNFAYSVTKVEINIENYWKYIDISSSYSMDTASKLHIGDELVDLSNQDNENDPTPVTKTCEYTTPITSLELYNEEASGRVILNSIKITYLVD